MLAAHFNSRFCFHPIVRRGASAYGLPSVAGSPLASESRMPRRDLSTPRLSLPLPVSQIQRAGFSVR